MHEGVWAAVAIPALLAAAAFWLRRRAPASAGGLSLEGRLALTPQCALAVVRAGGRRFLISAGGREARLLAELGRDEAHSPAPYGPPSEPPSARRASGGAPH